MRLDIQGDIEVSAERMAFLTLKKFTFFLKAVIFIGFSMLKANVFLETKIKEMRDDKKHTSTLCFRSWDLQ